MVNVPFSYIKKTSSGFDLVNVPRLYDFPNATTFEHGYGDGSVNGVQIHVIKIKAGQGDCTINISASSGQSLVSAFSFNRDALTNWISSGGSVATNVTVETGTAGSTITKVIDDPVTNDVYVWFGVGIAGNIGSPSQHPDYAYALQYSGNYHDPEVLFITGNVQVGVPTGSYGNPALLNPNEGGTSYSATNGDCISGSFYFTFNLSMYVPRTITLQGTGVPMGFAVSSNKEELQAWISNGASGPLTDSYGSPYSNVGSEQLVITINPTNTLPMYGVYYNPSNPGANSCTDGALIVISSLQEEENGSNSGTFVNPYTISNNTNSSSANVVNRSNGECQHGAVYYSLSTCSNSNLGVAANPMNGQYVGIGISYSKENLAEFLLTQNHALLEAYYEGYGNTGSGGGGGNCGTFNNPADTYNSDYTSFYGDQYLNFGYSQWMFVTVEYNDLYSLPDYCSTCGQWANPYDTFNSDYWAANGDLYTNIGYETWSGPLGTIVNIGDLPDVTNSYTNGRFDNPLDKYNSSYFDYSGNYYTNFGFGRWMLNSWAVYDITSLPDYCAGGGGSGSFSADLNYITPNDGTYYVIVYDPYNIGGDSCSNYDQFQVTTEQLYCGGGGGGQDGTYPNPFEYYPNNYGGNVRVFKEGDCGNGQVWFKFTGLCRAPASISYSCNGNSTPTFVWSTSKEDILAWINNGQSGTLTNGGSMYSMGGGTGAIFVKDLPVRDVYACIFIGGYQCTNNTDSFTIDMYQDNCYDFNDESGTGAEPASSTDPIVLRNNDSRSTVFSAGDCNNGTLYYQIMSCTEPLTFTANTGALVGIAYANDINQLATWVDHHGSWSHDLSEWDGGFVESDSVTPGNTVTFTPSANGNYYVAVYKQYFTETCTFDSSIYVSTSQTDCNGAGNDAGTFSSPIVIGNNDTSNIGVDTGDCFTGQTYFSVVKCADNPMTITITPGDNAYPQGIIWATNLSGVKNLLDYYITYGSVPSYGGYYHEGNNIGASSTSSPLVSTLPAHTSQETMYFCVFDIDASRGTPRCARPESSTIALSQSCPTIIVGGTSNLSGAANYEYDPFNTGLSGDGIALSVSDPSSASVKSLMYSPTLVIDAIGDYPSITCSNIEISMYANDISGNTALVATDTTTYTEVIVPTPNDPESSAFIKPRTGHEFFIPNVNFYTSIIVVTFNTNVGNIVRTQVINQGGTFTGDNKQYGYVTNMQGPSFDLIVPSARGQVQRITTGTNIGNSKVVTNTFNIVDNGSIWAAGDSYTVPFKYVNKSLTNNVPYKIPSNYNP